MICSSCNGEGRLKRFALSIKKKRCETCFGTGSLCRQQLRQAERRDERENRGSTGAAAADLASRMTGGFNRKQRRDAYRATRRRNDGRRKTFAVDAREVRFR